MAVDLDDARCAVIDACRAARRATGPGGPDDADRPDEADDDAVDPFRAPTLPAAERYTGVLYGALGYAGLDRPVRRRVDQQVLTFSGLWGLVAPRDPIPAYRLKMSATVAGLGRLATWWRPRLGPVLDERVEGRVVWDLLPGEHVAAWPTSSAPRRRIAVRFLDDVDRGGERELVTVSHWNKLLKGSLVRHVVERQLTRPDGLADFAHPQGYEYRPDLTVDDGVRTVVSFVARR
jgi:cytoplasmic iron level regulating protein YaaA (DUF328/UPF0246 family)